MLWSGVTRRVLRFGSGLGSIGMIMVMAVAIIVEQSSVAMRGRESRRMSSLAGGRWIQGHGLLVRSCTLLIETTTYRCRLGNTSCTLPDDALRFQPAFQGSSYNNKPHFLWVASRLHDIASLDRIFFHQIAGGDWAGGVYPQSGCPSTCVGMCLIYVQQCFLITLFRLDYVDNNPEAFKDAYFDFAALRVYT